MLDAVRTSEKDRSRNDVTVCTKHLRDVQPLFSYAVYVQSLKDTTKLGSQYIVNLYALEETINMFNEARKHKPEEQVTPLDLLKAAFSHVPTAAKILAIMKKSQISGPKAEQLQNLMLTWCLDIDHQRCL